MGEAVFCALLAPAALVDEPPVLVPAEDAPVVPEVTPLETAVDASLATVELSDCNDGKTSLSAEDTEEQKKLADSRLTEAAGARFVHSWAEV